MAATRLPALALLAAVLGSAAATPYTNCTEGQPSILSLNVEGCDEIPCSFTTGDQIVADVLFKTEWATRKLTPEVKATVYEIINITYELPEPDGCKTLLQAECPLEAGERVTYRLSMPLPSGLPTVTVIVQLTLQDDSLDAMACFVLEVAVRG